MNSNNKDTNFKYPSKSKLNILLEHYQNDRFEDAEQVALNLTQKYPEDVFAWKVLSAIFWQTGRRSDGIELSKKTISLSPNDDEAHSNLGVMLQEEGRLKEAEASLINAISLNSNNPKNHYNLGVILKKLGRLKDAQLSYEKAISFEPNYFTAYNNLGDIFRSLGKLEEAKLNFKKAISIHPDYAEAHLNLGAVLVDMEKLEEAVLHFKKAISLKPDYSKAKHMLAALTGKTTSTAPQEYVESLFDNYALRFESSLVSNLEYKIPKILTEIIIEDSKTNSLGSIIDLGCGTGLFGEEIKKFCDSIIGIDLSKRMLDQAEKKNIYNELIKEDIVTYLSNNYFDFDYFISLDVFIYVGDLSNIFKLIKARNKKSGKLAFSVENYDGESFFLERSGRYSHSKTYIENLCDKFGYRISYFKELDLRKEKNKYISGALYILEF